MTSPDPRIRAIVLGLDEGDLAKDALEAAMDVATAFDARLDIVHAVDVHPLLRGRGRAPEWAAEAQRRLKEARSRLEGRLSLVVEHPRFAELPVDEYLTVRAGRPTRVLLDFAVEKGADLIVLGRHRHRRLFDFGATTRAVLSQSPCPIWLQAGPHRPVKRILAAVDVSQATERVLAYARAAAQAFEAEVVVLHCFLPLGLAAEEVPLQPPPGTGVLEAVREADRAEFQRRYDGFDWHGVAATPLLVEGEAADEILARQEDFELIAMGTHGRTGIARALLGSQSYRVLKHAERAVLAVPHG